MLSEERYEKILKLLKSKGYIKVTPLSASLGVSIETIRRDLFYLESRGLLKRVHGGATCINRMHQFSNYAQRLSQQSTQKKSMAKLAVSLIHENDILAIDCGSTALELAYILRESFQNLTIITNSVAVFHVLMDVPGFQLISTGGQFFREESAFFGTMAEERIRQLHVQKSFVFPSAISLQYGIADFLMEFVSLQKAYMEIADQVIIMADSSKFETTGLIKLCELNTSFIYLTDAELDDAIYQHYTDNSIQILRGDNLAAL